VKSKEEFLGPVRQLIIGLKSDFLEILPGLVNGLIVLIVGVFIAYLIKWSSKLIVKTGLRFLPNSITEKDIIKDNLSDLILGTGRILFLITIFLAITSSLKKMGFFIVSEWMQSLAIYIPNIIGAILILFVGWMAKNVTSDLVFRALNKTDFVHSQLAAALFSWSVFIISLLVALDQVGIDMNIIVIISTVLIAVFAGGLTLTFALGARAIISDILYCFQLNKHLKVGNEIEVSGFKGTVKSIGPTFVTVKTSTGEIAIPGNVFNREITLVLDSGGQ
jgi:hypothetical protein